MCISHPVLILVIDSRCVFLLINRVVIAFADNLFSFVLSRSLLVPNMPLTTQKLSPCEEPNFADLWIPIAMM